MEQISLCRLFGNLFVISILILPITTIINAVYRLVISCSSPRWSRYHYADYLAINYFNNFYFYSAHHYQYQYTILSKSKVEQISLCRLFGNQLIDNFYFHFAHHYHYQYTILSKSKVEQISLCRLFGNQSLCPLWLMRDSMIYPLPTRSIINRFSLWCNQLNSYQSIFFIQT